MINRKEFLLYALASLGTTALGGGFARTAFASNGNATIGSAAASATVIRDSFGRSIAIPSGAKLYPLGMFAQSVLYSIDPKLLSDFDPLLTEEQRDGIIQEGGILSATGAESDLLLLDIGSAEKANLNRVANIENKSGSTMMFFEGGLESLADAYRVLDNMFPRLGCLEKADYLDNVSAMILDREFACHAEDSITIYIATSPSGTRTASYSYLQRNVLDHLNVRCVNDDVASNDPTWPSDVPLTDNLERVARIDPDRVLFKDVSREEFEQGDSAVGALWRYMPHTRGGRLLFAPSTSFSWIGAPLIAQGLGLLWLASNLRPNVYEDVDVSEFAVNFYRLFVGCEVTQSSMHEFLAE